MSDYGSFYNLVGNAAPTFTYLVYFKCAACCLHVFEIYKKLDNRYS